MYENMKLAEQKKRESFLCSPFIYVALSFFLLALAYYARISLRHVCYVERRQSKVKLIMAGLVIFQSHLFLLYITSANVLCNLEFFCICPRRRHSTPFKAGKDDGVPKTSQSFLTTPKLQLSCCNPLSYNRQLLPLNPDK